VDQDTFRVPQTWKVDAYILSVADTWHSDVVFQHPTITDSLPEFRTLLHFFLFF
jgi:hypothetical protein